MVRRTGWHYYRRDAQELARRVTEWMAEFLGWSNDDCSDQLARYRKLGASIDGVQDSLRQRDHASVSAS